MGGSSGVEGGVVLTPLDNHKWLCFIKITGTDPIEKHLDPRGPIAFQGGPYSLLRNALMTQMLSGPPPTECSRSAYTNSMFKQNIRPLGVVSTVG